MARTRWWALAVVVMAEFVVFLDIAVVNVALPEMTAELGLGSREIGLVVNAYQVVFGALLLLGGRIADALGRARVFLAGFGVFTAASLFAGLANDAAVLVTARAMQGLGAALLVPATTALIVALFSDQAERSRAFGIWGAMRAGGASSGSALGGVITQALGWEWIFLINVPIGIVVLLAGAKLLPQVPRDPEARPGIVAGLSATGGLLLLSVALAEGPASGWASPTTLASAAGATVLVTVFLGVQARSTHPLVPRRVLTRPVLGATVASLLYGASHIPMFLLLSFYLQESLALPPAAAGLALLPIGVVVMAASSLLVPRLLRARGSRSTLLIGLGVLAAGLLLMAAAPRDGTYLINVLPAGLLAALGLACCFAGVTLPAVETVTAGDTGIASGMVNSAQRIGSGLGVAMLVALPAAGPSPQSVPLVGAAALAALGMLAAAVILPRTVQSNSGPAAQAETVIR